MRTLYNWHKNITEKNRLFWNISHYQVYWISWLKGLITALLIVFLASCNNVNNKPEWTYLFDGKTTNGWKAYNGEKIPKKWAAIDGNLTFDTQLKKEDNWKGGGDIIYYLEEFDNFELYLEWKLPVGGNSGIFYHLKEGYPVPYAVSPEYQLIDDFGWGKLNKAELEEWQKAGADYAMYSPDEKIKKLKPAGEWNSTKIKYTAEKVEHWLNNELILSFVPYSTDWFERKNNKWANYPDYGKFKKGYIGLQDHDSPIWFREIKIKKLL